MSFHATTSNVSVVTENGRTYLTGKARRTDGSENQSRLDLDKHLGNHNGRLDWGGENFTASATNITFKFEGGSNVPVLRAKLKNTAGVYVDTDKNLGERIKNDNGNFVIE